MTFSGVSMRLCIPGRLSERRMDGIANLLWNSPPPVHNNIKPHSFGPERFFASKVGYVWAVPICSE